MGNRSLIGVIALCAVAGATDLACKSNNINDTTNNVTNNAYVTQAVGAAGAFITGPGGSTVSVPAGALTSSVSIKIGLLVPSQYPSTFPAIPSTWKVAGYAFSFEPHGQKFTLPVTITVPYTGATMSSANLVTASPSGTWSTVGDAMFSDTTAQVDSTHFSYYAVVTGAPAASDAGQDSTADAGHDGGSSSSSSSGLSTGSSSSSSQDSTEDASTGVDAGHDSAPPPPTPDGGEGTPGASCAAGADGGRAGVTNCGPGGSGTDSCCASLLVTGGTYNRTYTNSGAGPTGEADPATVSSFRLDKYLVTVGRFRQFVSAWKAASVVDGGVASMIRGGSGKHTHLNGGKGLANSGAVGTYETGWVATDDSKIAPTDGNLLCRSPYNTWTSAAGTQENLPINCVNWYESYAFCIWDGGFLPSEAEWEYAAAGGSEQREYPWGSVGPGTGNQYAIYGLYYTGNATDIAPVGTANLGAGLWGQFDMAGEVWEWNADWLASYVSPCTDCAYLSAASDRVVRGGVFEDGTSNLLPPNRVGDDPADRDVGYAGFRCARTP